MSVTAMRAAVFYDRRQITIEEAPTPAPGPGDLLLEVHSVGVCGTDAAEFAYGPSMFPIHYRHPVTGHKGPMIPGHEFAGKVVEMGEGVSGFTEGDLVASGAGISCGTCVQCRDGMTNVCARYATLGLSTHGALAQYAVSPANICLEVGSLGLNLDTAALAQPMAIAHHAYSRGRPGTDQPVVILGAGGVGIFLTYVAAQSGGEVVVGDLNPQRLRVSQSLGATATVDLSKESLTDVLANLKRLPVIYEVTGAGSGFDLLWSTLPAGTRLVVVGVQKEDRRLDLRRLTLQEQELVGTNAHRVAVDLPAAARLLASRREGWSDVAPWVFPLEDLVPEGLEPMVEGRAERIKTLFDPWIGQARPFGG